MRPRRLRGSTKQESSSATSWARVGFVSPVAGGRARTTSSASLPRFNCGTWSPAMSRDPVAGPGSGDGFAGAQAELARDRPQRFGDERDVLVEFDAEELGAPVDVVAVDARGERRLLQLLPHRLRLERVDPVRANEPASVDEAGELIAREQRLLQRRIPR